MFHLAIVEYMHVVCEYKKMQAAEVVVGINESVSESAPMTRGVTKRPSIKGTYRQEFYGTLLSGLDVTHR